uniref:C2H2-type domain-containing protein n=1 Tax=Lepeophtheirus salmonis TaxID=72036 RepID=A0A0K2SXV8_LEPSM
MLKKRIEHLDPKINESAALASLMIVVTLEEGQQRFDCSLCHSRYKHHSSLFRHFKSAHHKEYEERVALRVKLKAERDAAISRGEPYLRRRNSKRGLRSVKKNKENTTSESVAKEAESPTKSTSKTSTVNVKHEFKSPKSPAKSQKKNIIHIKIQPKVEEPHISSLEEDTELLMKKLGESTNEQIIPNGTIQNITPSVVLIPIKKVPLQPQNIKEQPIYDPSLPLDLSLKDVKEDHSASTLNH